MKKRIRLNVTEAVKEFAKLHGAVFDKVEKVWYVEGEVPWQLNELVDPEVRQRNFQSENGPKCNLCDCHTVLKVNSKTGDQFWSCARFPACRGSRSWDYNASIHAVDLLATDESPSFTSPVSSEKKKIPLEVQDKAEKITAQAVELFGGMGPAMRWLEMPKAGLQQKAPLEVMNDFSGCEEVERLLKERFE